MLDEILKVVGVKDISDINEPIIQLVGNHAISITNACGLLVLEETRVEIRAGKSYKIIITGESLETNMISKHEISLQGRIISVAFDKL